MNKPLLITSGEPAGIGPDLCLLIAKQFQQRIVVMGDGDLLSQRAKALSLDISLAEVKDRPIRTQAAQPGFIHCPLAHRVTAGKPDTASASYVLSMHKQAVELCSGSDSLYGGLVTAPTDKALIHAGGEAFTDLTTYLRQLTSVNETLTMFIGDSPQSTRGVMGAMGTNGAIDIMNIKVAFITMHVPLMQLVASLSPQLISSKIRMTHQAIKHFFTSAEPHLALCGINPHAGEQGLLGDEERRLLYPVVEQLTKDDIHLDGPLSADALFAQTDRYDAIIAIYHDQGLAPFKALCFDRGAQWTYGLPFVRTSPDHGTAYDLAGKPDINCGSMIKAIQLAEYLSAKQ